MEKENPYGAPIAIQTEPAKYKSRRLKRLSLKKLDLISTATIFAAIYAAIGVIVGAMVAVLSILTGDTAPSMLFAGVGSIVVLPVVYGAIGFVGGLILAGVFNVVAGMTGGPRFSVEELP